MGTKEKELDNIKYKIIDVMNNINDELIKIRKLTRKLSYIWIEIEDINDKSGAEEILNGETGASMKKLKKHN